MDFKVALLLFLTIFAFTITTVAMALTITTPNAFSATKTAAFNTESGGFQPTGGGDGVDDPTAPC